jgi:hypothetical protein
LFPIAVIRNSYPENYEQKLQKAATDDDLATFYLLVANHIPQMAHLEKTLKTALTCQSEKILDLFQAAQDRHGKISSTHLAETYLHIKNLEDHLHADREIRTIFITEDRLRLKAKTDSIHQLSN